MLGLDFSEPVAPETDLNLARVVGGRARKPSKTVNSVSPSFTETAEPSFGNGSFLLKRPALLVLVRHLRGTLAQFKSATERTRYGEL